MGLFKSLFYDGKKCYRCRRTDTEWCGSKNDLSAFPPTMQEWIADNAYNGHQHWGRNYDVYYCRRCKIYLIDFPSTYDIQGTQVPFTWNGQRLK